MKKCVVCKKEFAPQYTTTQKTCGIKCAIVDTDNKKEARVQRDIKAFKASTNKEKRELKRNSLKWQHNLTQKAFNRMRVLEEFKWFSDKGLEPSCISCGKPKGRDQWCNGHFKTRGAQGNLRYDRKNTYLQHNQRCNMRMSGDIEGTKTTRGYKKGLIERFGVDTGQEIIEYCETNTQTKKWTCDELEGLRAKFNKRIRELEG